METPHIYERLSPLFAYPGDTYAADAAQCLAAMRGEQPEAVPALEEFCAAIAPMTTDELQELFTRTFDLNPLCTLEIGWQLWGEDYGRGAFLVKMRDQLRGYDLAESGELHDHLTHALALLARLEPDEAAAFAGGFVLHALDKMRAAWRENRNAYAALLESTFVLLKSRYPYLAAAAPVRRPELPVLQ